MMMTEQVCKEAEALEKILQEQQRLVAQLYECVCGKEHALIENDLSALKKDVESEEDLTLSFSEQEDRRQKRVRGLTALLRMTGKEPSLLEIAGMLEDRELACRLKKAGKDLAESVFKVQQKNHTVREILKLKSEYTETLLKLMTGNVDAKNHGYGVHGEIVESGEPDRGMYEVLI